MEDLSKYIGKKFKYDSPYGGLSKWSATIKSIDASYKLILSEEADKALKKFSKSQPLVHDKNSLGTALTIVKERKRLSEGYKIILSVSCEESYHTYPLNRVVIL